MKKPVLLNGKIYNLPAREDFLELTNSLYLMIDALQNEVDSPQDEKLAEAHARIEKLQEELVEMNKKSLIVLTDEEYNKLEKWKKKHDRCLSKDLFIHRFCWDIKDRSVGIFCSTCGGGITLR